MKIGSLLIGMFAAFSLNAQVEIREFANGQEVGNDISGTEITMNVTEDAMYPVYWSVKNVSGEDKAYVIERWRIQEVSGWEDGLCWGPRPDPDFLGQCYTAQTMSTNPWTTPSWNSGPPNNDPVYMSDQSFGTIVVDIETHGPGCAHYRYYIKEGGTKVDSMDLVVCSSVSLKDNGNLNFSIGPNPTSNVVKLNLPTSEATYSISVFDVKGAVVNLPSMMNHTLDFSTVLNGIYTIVITDERGNSARRQVVVNH